MILVPLSSSTLPIATFLYREGVEWSTCTMPALSDDAIAGALTSPDSVWWVAVEEDVVVGLGGFERIKWVDRVAEPYISLVPGVRNKGWGKALAADLVMKGVKDLGLKRMQTSILSTSPSKAILEWAGWECEGVLKGVRLKEGKRVDGLMYAKVVE